MARPSSTRSDQVRSSRLGTGRGKSGLQSCGDLNVASINQKAPNPLRVRRSGHSFYFQGPDMFDAGNILDKGIEIGLGGEPAERPSVSLESTERMQKPA